MTEESKLILKHSVEAIVNVTVKVIPEEAVDKSGSIRLSGVTAEEFIAPDAVSYIFIEEFLVLELKSIF